MNRDSVGSKEAMCASFVWCFSWCFCWINENAGTKYYNILLVFSEIYTRRKNYMEFIFYCKYFMVFLYICYNNLINGIKFLSLFNFLSFPLFLLSQIFKLIYAQHERYWNNARKNIDKTAVSYAPYRNGSDSVMLII